MTLHHPGLIEYNQLFYSTKTGLQCDNLDSKQVHQTDGSFRVIKVYVSKSASHASIIYRDGPKKKTTNAVRCCTGDWLLELESKIHPEVYSMLNEPIQITDEEIEQRKSGYCYC